MMRAMARSLGSLSFLYVVFGNPSGFAQSTTKPVATTQSQPTTNSAPNRAEDSPALIGSAARPKQTSSRPARSFEEARSLFLRGEYESASAGYVELGKLPRRNVDAACALAEIDRILGRYEEALARLKAVEADAARSPAWHTAMAEALAEVGRYEDAIEPVRKAIELRAVDARARYRLGMFYETLGRSEEALKTYAWFDERMTGEPLPEDAEQMTYIGRGFYRYSVLKRHPDLTQRTQHVLTEVYQEVMDYLDASYWPARLAAGELLLEKFNLPGAEAEFKQILAANERVPDALVAQGEVALDGWQFEKVEELVAAAQKINARHVGSWVLLGKTRMTERRYEDAEAAAKNALETNPNSIDGLSLLAAAQLRRGDAAASAATQARLRKINPTPATMHFTLATWLALGRQFDEAETHFKKAIEFAAWWPAPRTELGLMYMETGEEGQARKMLDVAFEMDNFNRRTFNVLGLLDDLSKFDRLTTENFILKYHESTDGVAAPYLSGHLEHIHGEVCGDYNVKLEKSTIVELLPNHDQFSVRITGRPFIATVGACTGRVIAMTAPRGDPPFGRFNWADVLRHEFTHTVTLAATNNRIPHWFTEGLAVHQEQHPRSWAWKLMLAEALRRDRLFSVRSIDWGFMRPRRRDDRTLAYAQSQWMVDFIIAKHRFSAILELLKTYKDGKTQAQAFQAVLGCDEERFTADFKAWAKEQVVAWGMRAEPFEAVDALQAKLKATPDDAALHARLAEAQFAEGEPEAAEEAVARALELDAEQPQALEVRVRLFLASFDEEDDPAERGRLVKAAEPFVRRLNKRASDNPYALKAAALFEISWEEWDEAVKWFSRYQQRCPEDPESYRRIAAICLKKKDLDGALPQLEQLFRLTIDDPAVARQVAEIYGGRGDMKAALGWYEKALHVDPYDPQTHLGLGEAALEAGEYPIAEREFKVVCRLLPKESQGYEGLGNVYEKLGDTAKAEENRRRAAALGGGAKDHDEEPKGDKD